MIISLLMLPEQKNCMVLECVKKQNPVNGKYNNYNNDQNERHCFIIHICIYSSATKKFSNANNYIIY